MHKLHKQRGLENYIHITYWMPSTSNRGVCKSGCIPGGAEIRNKKKKKKREESGTKVGNIICNIGIVDAKKQKYLGKGASQNDIMDMQTCSYTAVYVSAQEDTSKKDVCASTRENRYKELFDRQIDKNLRMISRHLRRSIPEMFGRMELYARVSKIHGIGIFAGTDIPAGTKIVEYVGELIGKKVADKRERFYKENGILSVYLFKILDDLIVDATLKGNLARFINHSCNPNAMARISRGRIFIYSTHKIKGGEEITFYYNFSSDEHDDTRLPCYCGHDICTKFMG